MNKILGLQIGSIFIDYFFPCTFCYLHSIFVCVLKLYQLTAHQVLWPSFLQQQKIIHLNLSRILQCDDIFKISGDFSTLSFLSYWRCRVNECLGCKKMHAIFIARDVILWFQSTNPGVLSLMTRVKFLNWCLTTFGAGQNNSSRMEDSFYNKFLWTNLWVCKST